MNKKTIILIGGAPTTGKSTIAEMLARHLDIPWISTDQIREMLRAVVKREDLPKLFTPKDYTAEKFLTEFSSEQIVDSEMGHGEAIWPAIKRLVEQDWVWERGFVLEGVEILPHLVSENLVNIK